MDTNANIPYADMFLELFKQGNSDLLEAFGTHLHLGYWDAPSLADGSVEDFARASEQMCHKLCSAGNITDNQAVLDVGCGFGGTIAHINRQFKHMELVGLNINNNQLERARQQVQAAESNQVTFVQGDACQLPFEKDSFDLVLANECIFHFPSREGFFQEARRVLRPNGYLAISDFVPVELVAPFLKLWRWSGLSTRFHGKFDNSYTLADYKQLAQELKFEILQEQDITINTLPSYPFTNQLLLGRMQPGLQTDYNWAMGLTEWTSFQGLLRYVIFSFSMSA